MTRARRRHPALARKIDAISAPTKTPGIRIAIIGSDTIVAPCGCMTESDPTDGIERVFQHSSDCHENPDYDPKETN